MKSKYLPKPLLAIILTAIAVISAQSQDAQKPAVAAKPQPTASSVDTVDKLALTDTEKTALTPLNTALERAQIDFLNAGDALRQAKGDDAILARAYRWREAASSFEAANQARNNWIGEAAKARGCADCRLNLATHRFEQPAKAAEKQ